MVSSDDTCGSLGEGSLLGVCTWGVEMEKNCNCKQWWVSCILG